jgi:sulfofructose kinase
LCHSTVTEKTKKSGPVLVVGLGQACVDYLGKIPFYPHEDTKLELMELGMRCGGPASTALVTLSRLGISTAFLGSVSDDPFGVEIVRHLRSERVDISGLKITPGHTSQFAFIAVTSENGHRTIFWHRGSVPHLMAVDVDMDPFASARILHVDGLMEEACIEAAMQARKAGMTVVMDAGTMREGTRKLIPLVDFLIASETFGDPLAGPEASKERILEELQGLGPRRVVITLGAKGSIGFDGREIIRQKAFEVRARDTTGAGDVYHGAYIYGMLRDWDMGKCMRFASAAAALRCTGAETPGAVPNLDSVLGFMKSHS